MATRWTRTRDLALPPQGADSTERWELQDDAGKIVASYPMQVRLGKPFDVLRMKGQSPAQLRDWTAQVAKAVSQLYAPGAPRRTVKHCPCCGAPVAAEEAFCRIHGVAYQRCLCCMHLFVREQPAQDVLNRMFAENDDYAHEYVSQEGLDQRLREIVTPKLDWVRAIYRQRYGRELRSVVDVGAGGGHFVACGRRAGLAAEGYEINRAAVAFAKTAFAVDLRSEDFLAVAAQPGHADLVTCWGLLEYTPEPARFMAAARQRLAADGGMLVLEVPRADAFGSAIQAQFPESVWRHLAPASHVNVFSDASLATLLHDNGFRPIAAWYFGMDFFELLCQFASALDDERLLTQLGRLVAPMQAQLDIAEFVDDIIVAAVPV
jgi:2-polyprenyl-3-methyl-5-hydroxy-6-metoxy-1,4-benzoquinol methylase